MIDALEKIPGMRSRIGRRLILYVLLFSSVITFMGTGLQLYLDYDHDVQVIHASLEQIKSSYLGSITNSLWVTDDELLRIQLEGILRLPDMQLIEVRKESEPFLTVGSPQSESVIEQTIPLVFVYNGRDIHLGDLHVVASLKGIYARLLDRVLLILGVQTVKTFLVSLFIFVIFHQLVGRYIIHMAAFVESINFESLNHILRLDRNPAKEKPDELDKLASAFNRMRENLSQDILRREAAEKELRESEDKFRSISERSHVGIYLIQDNVFKYVNPKFCEVFGYTLAECQDDLPFIDLVHPDEAGFVREQVRKRLDGEADFLQYETRCIKKSGEIIDVVILGSTTSYKGSPAAIGTILDVTQQKKMEARLQQAQKMESIGTLAGGIAHDFNNILFPIMGMAELLLEDLPKNSLEFENAEEIFIAGKRGSELVKQILAFSRQTEHRMMPVKAQKVLQEAVKLSRATIPSNIKIVEDIQKDCGTIIADQTQLHQIAMNLITNAYHAVEKSNGSISVSLNEAIVDLGDLADTSLQPGQYAKGVEKAPHKEMADQLSGNEMILLVDDEKSVVLLEKQILTRLGYDVTEYTNSTEALAAFKAAPAVFDLVISDMTMPDMTGDRLVKAMKAIRPDIPIIICTGYSERIDREIAAAIGLDAFVMKPIVKSEFARVIRDVLDKTGDA